MRKAFTLGLLAFAGTAVMAQHTITSAQPVTLQPNVMGASKVATVDTITTYLDRSTGYYLLSAGSNGYVLGTSAVSNECAMHYDGLGSTTVTEVFAYIAAKEVMGGTADSLTAYAYAAGLDSMPGTLIGIGRFSVADADTGGFPTLIPLTNTTATNGGFLVSIAYAGPGTDDSLAVLSNNPTTQSGGPDGAGEKRCRLYIPQLGWMRAAEVWTIAGAPFNADAIIVPVVDFTSGVGIDNHVGQEGFLLFPGFPSPTNAQYQVVYSTDIIADVTLTVFDRMGRAISRSTENQVSAGKHNFAVDASDWAAGTYYYILSNGRNQIASKFTVVH